MEFVRGGDTLPWIPLREEITDIQYGRRPDPHGWMIRLDA